MLFKVKQYNAKPVRCFKCSIYDHVTNHCRGKERCSNCGGEHNWKTFTASYKQCPNCKGEHSAIDKQCPRFKRVTEVLRIKTASKITYSEACRKYISANTVTTPRVVQPSDFLPLPALPCDSPVANRPLLSKRAVRVAYPYNEEMITNNELDDSGVIIGKPLLFLAFLADVIKQTITAKDHNEPANIFKIITESAVGTMGITINAEQLKYLTT